MGIGGGGGAATKWVEGMRGRRPLLLQLVRDV